MEGQLSNFKNIILFKNKVVDTYCAHVNASAALTPLR